MASETLAAAVAAEWLAASATLLVVAVRDVLAERRALADAAAERAWVWHRPVHVEGYGGPLDLAEAQVWWRRMQRENEKERDACTVLDGLGMGA